jgi:hypothetical protein
VAHGNERTEEELCLGVDISDVWITSPRSGLAGPISRDNRRKSCGLRTKYRPANLAPKCCENNGQFPSPSLPPQIPAVTERHITLGCDAERTRAGQAVKGPHGSARALCLSASQDMREHAKVPPRRQAALGRQPYCCLICLSFESHFGLSLIWGRVSST